MKKKTKKTSKKILESYLEKSKCVVDKAYRDALVYGFGLLRIDQAGEIHNISPKQVERFYNSYGDEINQDKAPPSFVGRRNR